MSDNADLIAEARSAAALSRTWRTDIASNKRIITQLADALERSEAEVERLRASLVTDIDQIRQESSEEPHREPDHLEDLLDIDPNDDLQRLAARAVQYRYQRLDLVRRAERAAAQVQAVRALVDGADDRDDVEAYWHTDTWPGGRMAVNAVMVHELRTALDTGSDS